MCCLIINLSALLPPMTSFSRESNKRFSRETHSPSSHVNLTSFASSATSTSALGVCFTTTAWSSPHRFKTPFFKDYTRTTAAPRLCWIEPAIFGGFTCARALNTSFQTATTARMLVRILNLLHPTPTWALSPNPPVLMKLLSLISVAPFDALINPKLHTCRHRPLH